MHIADSKALLKAIDELNRQRIAHENEMLDKLTVIKGQFDPVYQINRILPRQTPVGVAVNTILDESLINAAYGVTDKIIPPSSNSMVKMMGHNFLQKILSTTINKNAYKIKVIGLAVVKNIFK